MRIKFVQRHVVQQGDGKGPVYEVGKEYEIADETYARKYIRRGWAEEVAPPIGVMRMAETCVVPPYTEAGGDERFVVAEFSTGKGPVAVSDVAIGVPLAFEGDASFAGAVSFVNDRRVVHAGRGRWNVIDADGNKLNDAPLSREAADALAAEPGKE